MATELTPYQRDILIRTALGEARGEGVEGMADVIQVILNRANSGEFPTDPAAAALQPNEFSTWNSGAGGNNPQQFSTGSDVYKRGERALDLVLSGSRPDYTGGALFYKTPAVKSPFHDSQNKYGTIERNGHLFYPTRPVPPGEIPNVVASLQDTTPPPRVAPNPATISPDLSLMRNPQMSSSARMAQVTPPLPQRRPVSPMDIARAPGTTVATIPTSTRPGQSQIERITPMPPAREIAMAPGTTIATIPTTPRALPALPRTIPGQSQIERPMPSAREIASAPGTTIATIPTSGIGQPPATRAVPSVPYTLQPTAREIAQAPGVTVATIPTAPTQPMNIRSRDSVANTALGQRVATQMAPAFNQPSFIPDRLVPNPIVQPSFVPLNQAPLQVVPSPLSSAVPLPRRRPLTPISPVQRTAQPMPRMAAPASPLRIVVNGGNMIQPQRTTVQSLQSSGLSPSDAYALANAQAAQRARDSATSPSHVSSNSWFNEVTGRA